MRSRSLPATRGGRRWREPVAPGRPDRTRGPCSQMAWQKATDERGGERLVPLLRERATRTAGAQPRDIRDGARRTAGPQPRDVRTRAYPEARTSLTPPTTGLL